MNSTTGGNQNLDLVQQWENEKNGTGNPPNSDLVHRTTNEKPNYNELWNKAFYPASQQVANESNCLVINTLVNTMQNTTDHVEGQKNIRKIAHEKLEKYLSAL